MQHCCPYGIIMIENSWYVRTPYYGVRWWNHPCEMTLLSMAMHQPLTGHQVSNMIVTVRSLKELPWQSRKLVECDCAVHYSNTKLRHSCSANTALSVTSKNKPRHWGSSLFSAVLIQSVSISCWQWSSIALSCHRRILRDNCCRQVGRPVHGTCLSIIYCPINSCWLDFKIWCLYLNCLPPAPVYPSYLFATSASSRKFVFHFCFPSCSKTPHHCHLNPHFLFDVNALPKSIVVSTIINIKPSYLPTYS